MLNPGIAQTGLLDPQALAGQAERLSASGRYREAVQLYQRAVEACPSNAEWHYRFGFVAWNAGERDLAGRHFVEAARLAPNHPASHQALADWCRNMGDLAGALHYSERAAAIAPDEPDVMTSRAWALADSGRSAEAWGLIERLIDVGHCSPRLTALCGQLAPVLGREEAAWSVLSSVLASPALAPLDRQQVHFAAAQVLDHLGRYDEAFSHATAAHEAYRRQYDPQFMRRLVDRRIEYYSPRKLHDLPRASHGNRRPVFIVGMPRSGTTLVEQILASHSEVYGAGELTIVQDVAKSIAAADPESSFDFPECLDALPLRGCNRQANRILSTLESVNATARFVIDKMPQDYLYLGVIAMLFPDSHIVHCVRDPLDVCLSCYMTHFTLGHEFAQDLEHLGDYYTQYRRLMTHWHDVLHYPMIEVHYEDVVADLEGQTRRLLECLDLPWEPGCIEFHKTQRLVTTASKHQVRKPIYDQSVGRWRHYEKHLSKLKVALGMDVSV